jgi:hypothetical protein
MGDSHQARLTAAVDRPGPVGGFHRAASAAVRHPAAGSDGDTILERRDRVHRHATRHGAALLAAGFNVAQVVRDYGDICQAITE